MVVKASVPVRFCSKNNVHATMIYVPSWAPKLAFELYTPRKMIGGTVPKTIGVARSLARAPVRAPARWPAQPLTGFSPRLLPRSPAHPFARPRSFWLSSLRANAVWQQSGAHATTIHVPSWATTLAFSNYERVQNNCSHAPARSPARSRARPPTRSLARPTTRPLARSRVGAVFGCQAFVPMRRGARVHTSQTARPLARVPAR